jgi:thiamine-phosphate pyrophosphorylase
LFDRPFVRPSYERLSNGCAAEYWEKKPVNLSDLTPAAERAMSSAKMLAAAANAGAVQPLHLFQALAGVEDGQAARLIPLAGGIPQDLRERFVQELPAKVGQDSAGYRMGNEVGEILLRARALANEVSGESAVGSDHLLLALIKHDREIRDAFARQGTDISKLEAALMRGPAVSITVDTELDLSGPTEKIDTNRILDANANRAREAARAVEDYCRFVLGDAFLSRQLKQLRHDLAELLPSAIELARARDTLRDVGTEITTQAEQSRRSPQAVAEVNLKRLQEALRSLEEYGKVVDSRLAERCAQLRYRTYTLEKALLQNREAAKRLADVCLYVLVSRRACRASLEWTIKEAAAGGAGAVQLREKAATDRDLLARAEAVRRWTRQERLLFIMNDRPDIARLVEADGVHVGQEELPVKEVRRIVGAGPLVGVSTHNLTQVKQAILDGATYLGIGPVFSSDTKEFKSLAGLEFFKQAAGETSLPCFAIGGMDLENIKDIVAAGAKRVAVGKAICQAESPRAVAAAFRRALQEGIPAP